MDVIYMEGQRNYSLDILRIFACIGVIMIHASGGPEGHHWVEVGSYEWNWCATFDALSRWSVPIFAMLSGFLFLNPQKELPLSKLYGKYVARIVVALIFWSCFYAITLHKHFYPFGSQEGHFWYLKMCIGLYMAMPIMRYIVQIPHVLSYFCWTWLFFKVYAFMSHFVTMPIDLYDHHLFSEYVGYCLWAYYLSTNVLSRKYELGLYGLAIIGLVANVIGYILTKDSDCCFAGYSALTNIATSFGLFYLCAHHNINLGGGVNNFIQTVSECTFGVYLIHMWMLYLVFCRVHRFVPTPILTVLISVVLVYVGGLIVIYVIKRTPFFKKWIV